MGAGPNFVLDKGYLATGADAYTAGEVVAPNTAVQSTKRATSAGAADNFGVCMESVDATKVATGKVFLNVRRLGIARVKTGGAFAKGAKLINDASARAVAAAAKGSFFAIAEEESTGANQYVEALVLGYTNPADTTA